MIVGTMTVELIASESRSLKDKRRVIQSVKTVLRDRYNVSVDEVDHMDSHQRCTLGLAIVSKDAQSVHARFDSIVDLVRAKRGVTLLEYHRELF